MHLSTHEVSMYQKIDEITDTSFVEEKFLKYILHEEALAKWLSSSSHNLKSEGSNPGPLTEK